MKITIPATRVKDEYDINIDIYTMIIRVLDSDKLDDLITNILYEDETDIKVIGHALLSLCENIKDNAIEERMEELRQNKRGSND